MVATDRILSVQARWDAEAGVWVGLSDDVPGLVAEAASLDELFRDLQTLVPELLTLNGMGHRLARIERRLDRVQT